MLEFADLVDDWRYLFCLAVQLECEIQIIQRTCVWMPLGAVIGGQLSGHAKGLSLCWHVRRNLLQSMMTGR